MHSAEDIVACIRAPNTSGKYELSASEAALMINLFASVAVTKAERDVLVRIGDHAPEPLNENVSESQYEASQEALAHILGGAR